MGRVFCTARLVGGIASPHARHRSALGSSQFAEVIGPLFGRLDAF